jgi:Flp pilus assembly protein TadD
VLGGDPADSLDSLQAAALQRLAAEQVLNLAEVQIARGQLPQAAATLERLRRSQPKHQAALQRLAECRALLNDDGACLTLARSLLAADPDDPWGHLAMAAWCALRQDHAGARPHLACVAVLAGAEPRIALRMGGLHLLGGRPAEAAACFRNALATAEGWLGLGTALAASGDMAAAEAALRDSIARQPRQPQAHRQLAAVLLAQRRWQEALAALQVAEGQQSGTPEAAEMMAEARVGLAHDIATALLERDAVKTSHRVR